MSFLADSNISVVNNVFIKQMVFPYAGYTAVTHAHVYDHQTLLAAGSLLMTVDGIATIYQAPAVLVIKAGTHHGMTAMVDNTIAYCIHAITNGECIDEADALVQGIGNQALTNLA